MNGGLPVTPTPVAAAADPAAGPIPPRQTARGDGRMDLTGGPIAKTLILFALPTLASNILQTLSGSVNAIWVGQFLGNSALAATANANIIMFLMFGAFFGFGMAATVLIGQSMGRGDIDAARRAPRQRRRDRSRAHLLGRDRDHRLVRIRCHPALA